MLRDRVVARHHLRNVAVEAVDVALVLAADSSGSISNQDLALQFRGYAEAITSYIFMNAVRSGRHGRIALSFLAWSSAGRHDQLVPWLLIDGISAARKFATTLLHAAFWNSHSGGAASGLKSITRCGQNTPMHSTRDAVDAGVATER